MTKALRNNTITSTLGRNSVANRSESQEEESTCASDCEEQSKEQYLRVPRESTDMSIYTGEAIEANYEQSRVST